MNGINLLEFHLKLKGFQWVKVIDASMKPTLSAGNVVKIIPANILYKGEIVVFIRQDHLVIHRIVSIYKEHVFFKGDNNLYIDNDSRLDKIVGKIKNRTLFSSFIASLSYSNVFGTKQNQFRYPFTIQLLKFFCLLERYQRLMYDRLCLFAQLIDIEKITTEYRKILNNASIIRLLVIKSETEHSKGKTGTSTKDRIIKKAADLLGEEKLILEDFLGLAEKSCSHSCAHLK